MKYIKVKESYYNDDANKQARFVDFCADLEKLSKKYGICVQSVGGVHIYGENELRQVRYDNDYTSGDLIYSAH